jgi:hypothetical protein
MTTCRPASLTFQSPPAVVSAASPSPRLGSHHPSSRLASRARQRQAHDAAFRDRSSPGKNDMGATRVIGGNYACSNSEDANLTRSLNMSQRPRPRCTGRRSSVRPGWNRLAVVHWREPHWQDEWHFPKLCWLPVRRPARWLSYM